MYDPSMAHNPVPQAAPTAPVAVPTDFRAKTLRVAAGKVWKDPAMSDWPEDDYRVFVGNLGPEVTDGDLNRAFSKYKTLQRSRVVFEAGPRGKSRGYGFLSFGDARDFLSAMKDMNGSVSSRTRGGLVSHLLFR